MTKEELWNLFPIVLSEYNPAWREEYLAEEALLKDAVGNDHIVRISHIGSTSIPSMVAKPTVDILFEIKEGCAPERLIEAMTAAGYIYSSQPSNPAPHMMFMKGYTPYGFIGQAFHVHVRYSGDWDELYFRDYLLTHPETAKQYGHLKIKLKKKFEHDRDAYTNAKTGFIKRITKRARKEIGRRY
ncbi:MAG: GrpB family protein [Christensenellales bacterium]